MCYIYFSHIGFSINLFLNKNVFESILLKCFKTEISLEGNVIKGFWRLPNITPVLIIIWKNLSLFDFFDMLYLLLVISGTERILTGGWVLLLNYYRWTWLLILYNVSWSLSSTATTEAATTTARDSHDE